MAEALCRLYKDVNGRVGQHLLYGSPRPGCPGALADALQALAQGLSSAKPAMRYSLLGVVCITAPGCNALADALQHSMCMAALPVPTQSHLLHGCHDYNHIDAADCNALPLYLSYQAAPISQPIHNV